MIGAVAVLTPVVTGLLGVGGRTCRGGKVNSSWIEKYKSSTIRKGDIERAGAAMARGMPGAAMTTGGVPGTAMTTGGVPGTAMTTGQPN